MKRGAIKIVLPGGRPAAFIGFERPSGAAYEVTEQDDRGHPIGSKMMVASTWGQAIDAMKELAADAIGREMR
jgi:hypothetical protein